jgi:N-methylhydantoinase A/oxoprolinase/acetone carboxylase beta subunit
LKEMAFMGEDASAAIKAHRKIYCEGGLVTGAVYDGAGMGYGNRVKGPSVIEEPTTTIFLTPDYELTCDRHGNYLIYPQGTSLEEGIRKLAEIRGGGAA